MVLRISGKRARVQISYLNHKIDRLVQLSFPFKSAVKSFSSKTLVKVIESNFNVFNKIFDLKLCSGKNGEREKGRQVTL